MALGLTQLYGTYLLAADGSVVYFDCVTAEQVTRDAEITEFPVETGANISDHYRVKLNEVRLEVFVSNEPINPFIHPEGGGFYGAQTLVTTPYPTASTAASIAKAVVNTAGAVQTAISGALDTTTRPTTMNSVLQYASPFDSLANLLGYLDLYRANSMLLNIITASQIYNGFVLGKVETARDKETGSGAKVAMEFKRIVTVSTQTVTLPVPVKKKDTPPVNKGAQHPVDPGPYQSLASGLKGLAFGGT